MNDLRKMKLVKSRTNKMLTGVCGGIGELLGIDPTIIRLIWAALSLAGGILGGMSDGSEIIFRAAVKPTPSISQTQHTVTREGEPIDIQIKGRHDPIIVPRAVVVVQSMAALVVIDALMQNMTARVDYLRDFYKN